jgi:hypothetical protein
MMRLNEPLPGRPQQMNVQGLRFVREQDGEPERILKGRLVEAFRQRADVQRAYLAQMRWPKVL